MRIRRATLKDAAEIALLHRTTIRHINSKDYPPEDIEVWSGRAKAKRVRDSYDLAERYVAVESGKIIGFSDISKKEPEKLWGLYVHKDWIGRGVGSALLVQMEHAARTLGAKRLELSATITAKAFYEARGYTVLRKDKHEILHRKLDVFVMEKNFTEH